MTTFLRASVAISAIAALLVPVAQADPWFRSDSNPIMVHRSPDSLDAAERASAATASAGADQPGVDTEWIQRLPATVVAAPVASEPMFAWGAALGGAAVALASVAVLAGLLAVSGHVPHARVAASGRDR